MAELDYVNRTDRTCYPAAKKLANLYVQKREASFARLKSVRKIYAKYHYTGDPRSEVASRLLGRSGKHRYATATDSERLTLFARHAKGRAEAKKRFESLAAQWEKDTSLLSSPTRRAMHPAHADIINMGDPVVEFILERMRQQGGHWFWALSAITRENPVPDEAHGDVAAVRDAWLEWGSKRGYC